MRRITLSLSLLALSIGEACASGFALNDFSSSSFGAANAGRSSNPEDPTIMASNPAGLSLLEGDQLIIGSAYLMPDTEMTGRSILGGAAKSKDYSDNTVVPYMFYSTPITDR